MRVVDVVMLMCVVVMLAVGCKGSVDPQRAIAKAHEYREKGDYKAAIIEMKNVLQINSNHAEARYLLGLSYLNNREYAFAMEELLRALELSYERSKVMPALARSMILLGDYQKVLDKIPVEAHASAEVQADLLTLRARALLGLGRDGQARELLAAALVKQPEFAGALVEQARLVARERKWDEAVSLVDRAISSVPKHTDAWLMKGDIARAQDDRAGALASYQKILEFDPAHIEARLNITSLYIANNRLEDARKVINDIRRLAPANAMTFYMQAQLDFRARDFKAANDAIQQVLKVAPNDVPSVLLAGAILTELGSYEQARSQIGRVLEQAPGNLYARKLFIYVLARSGQTQRAIEVLQAGLQKAPEDRELMMLAGELYLQNGEFGKAAGYFDSLAKRDPKDAAVRTKLGMVRMASGDVERALADLESAVTLDSTAYQSDLLLVVSHLKQGHFDQALKAAESLEKKQPNNPVTFNLKAVIYLGKKDVPSARKNFERVLELQPTFVAAAVNLAHLDLREKKTKSARDRLEAILAKDQTNTQALLALVELSAALGATKTDKLNWLERAQTADPRAVQPVLLLARLHAQSGDSKKALDVLQQAQARMPDNPQVLDALGAIQMNAGQNEQALTTYRKLIQLQPKSPVALLRLSGVQTAMSDFAAAADSVKKALALKPDFLDAILAMVAIERRAGRHTEAINIARQVQKLDAKSTLGFVLEGDILLAEKKYPQAIKAYEVVHGMAKSGASLIKLNMAHVAAGRLKEADLQLVQWLKVSPDDSVVRHYAADTALKRGVYSEAIAHYEWLIQKQPNASFLNNLALAYHQVKDARAIEIAERAYKAEPGNAKIADTLGWLLAEQGHTARGIELLEKAAKEAPMVPSIGYHLAHALLKVGDKSKARVELERVLATKIGFPEEGEALKLLKQLGG